MHAVLTGQFSQFWVAPLQSTEVAGAVLVSFMCSTNAWPNACAQSGKAAFHSHAPMHLESLKWFIAHSKDATLVASESLQHRYSKTSKASGFL